MPQKPNILVILADQLRRQALSCHGDPNLQTPALDRLAERGVRCDRAYATYPICVPYRYTLMTGQYAHTRHVPGIAWRMSPDERTLADEFNDAGYDTLYIGKWHLHGGFGPGCMKRPVPREHQGRWKKWFGFELRNSHFDTVVFEDDDPTPIPLPGYQTDGLFDIAIREIGLRQQSGKPFACVLSVEPPHPPWQAPAELEAKWLERTLELRPSFMIPGDRDDRAASQSKEESDRDDVLRHAQLYYAMVENLHWNVGRLMEFMDRVGLSQSTTVLFTSDHGEMNGCHGLEQKQYPYEESVGVPLIVAGPGVAAGKVVDEPICTEDLFPTLTGLAGLQPRARLQGEDLGPLLGGDVRQLRRPGVMLEFVRESRPRVPFYERPWRGFVSRRHKYTVWGAEGELAPWQCFDLHEDPYEQHNLVRDPACEEVARQHHRWLCDRMVETGDVEGLAAAWGLPALNPWVVTRSRKAPIQR
jgi:arylsulfatase A-like enzyme